MPEKSPDNSTIPRPQSLITGLPREILREIIMELDHYSVRALLQAYNAELRDMFILITDTVTPSSPPEFFGGLNLDQCSLLQFDIEKNPKMRKYLIKLFEYVDHGNGQSEHILETRYKTPFEKIKFHPFMDRYSFVFSNRDPRINSVHVKCISIFHTGAKFFSDDIGVPQDEDAVFGPPWNQTWTKTRSSCHRSKKTQTEPHTNTFNGISDWLQLVSPVAQKLCTLTIQYVAEVENLYLPELKSLTIFFGSSNESIHSSSSPMPRISHINAPKVRQFSVLYHQQFPILEHVKVGYRNDFTPSPRSESGYRKPYRELRFFPKFRLIHVPGLEKQRTTPLPSLRTPVEAIDECDLGFIKNFKVIHIVGGHDHLLQEIDLKSACRALIWRQTNIQQYSTMWKYQQPITRIDAPGLEEFIFETLIDNTIVPEILTREKEQLTSIAIISYALGVNLKMLKIDREDPVSLILNFMKFPSTDEERESYSQPVINMSYIDNRFPKLKRLTISGYCKLESELEYPLAQLRNVIKARDPGATYAVLMCCDRIEERQILRTRRPFKARPRPADLRGGNRYLVRN